ncbi:hypothetical protein [Niveispirillum sp. KHB5.9]|uniref:hypothetical protein n=1 Tax=Niveispirillum sp. KHB5.9 TaxID=3400269 RepID=UPI003A85431F
MILYGLPLCLLYFGTGLLRTLWLDARVGAPLGALVELAGFLAAGVVGLALTQRWRMIASRIGDQPLRAGLVALGLFFGLDAAIAVGLCGVPLTTHFARFMTMAGAIQLAGLAAYAVLPRLWYGPA